MVDVVERDAPGLPANWLNGWLAAIGVTVLVPDVKVSWTDDVVPHAVFHVAEDLDLVAAIVRSLPSERAVRQFAIASAAGDEFPQVVRDLSLYRSRARLSRQSGDSTLGSSVTDLAEEEGAATHRGQFCVGMEGAETLWRRYRRCLADLVDAADPRRALSATFAGSLGDRLFTKANGLGFDPRRLVSGVQPADTMTDPGVEVLAFHGIQMFPVRSDGTAPAVQKPWSRDGNRTELHYPTWLRPLDRWAIDAFLDLPTASSRTIVGRRFAVRRLRPPSGQKKSAYFSEPVT